MRGCKKLSILIIGMSIVLLTGCGQNLENLGEEFTEEVNTLEGVEITVDESLDASTGITYTLSNQSDKDLNYGQDYGLQKEKNGKWYDVEPENPVAITMELLWLPAGNTDTLELSWESSYGELPAGHYRILKNVSDNENGYYLAGEFQVD